MAKLSAVELAVDDLKAKIKIEQNKQEAANAQSQARVDALCEAIDSLRGIGRTETAAEKPKRTRGKNKPKIGLPATSAVSGIAGDGSHS